MKQPEYGTLEPVVVEPKTGRSRAFAAAVATFLVVSAVVALSFGSGFMQANQAVDANWDRRNIARSHEDLQPQFQDACTNKNTRFVIAEFDATESSLVPVVKRDANPFNWGADFEQFKKDLPRFRKGIESGIAFAVYDLSVYTNPMKTKFTTIPVFVSYKARGTSLAKEYKGGAYMSAAALAAKCTKVSLPMTLRYNYRNYQQFCVAGVRAVLESERNIHGKDAASKGEFHQLFPGKGYAQIRLIRSRCQEGENEKCPFASPGSSHPVCSKKGPCGQVANWGTAPLWKYKNAQQSCCKAVVETCKGGAFGCNPYQKAVYARNCNKDYVQPSDRDPKTQLLAGVKPMCARQCRYQGCLKIKGDVGTLCGGCVDNGKVTCHQGAPGFPDMKCCGYNKGCKAAGDNRKMCSVLPKKGGPKCAFSLARNCGKIAAAQRIAVLKKASAKGSCTTGKKCADGLQVACCDGSKKAKIVKCAKKTSTFSKKTCKQIAAAAKAAAAKKAAAAAKKKAPAAKKPAKKSG